MTTCAVLDPHLARIRSFLKKLFEDCHHLQNFLVLTSGLPGPLMGIILFRGLGPLLGLVLVPVCPPRAVVLVPLLGFHLFRVLGPLLVVVLMCPPRTAVLIPMLVVLIIIVPPLLLDSPWAL